MIPTHFKIQCSLIIKCSKYFKEQSIFPKTLLECIPSSIAESSTAHGQESIILLQHIEEGSRFRSTRVSLEVMP